MKRLLLKSPLPAFALFACILINSIVLIPAIEALSREGRDFQQDYIAANRLLHREDIFSPATQEEVSSLRVDPTTGIKSNFHPVTTLLFVVPLLQFNFQIAVYVWSLISIICFIVGIYLISKEINFPQLFFISFFLFSWFPFWLHIRFGQFSTPIFLFVVLAWRAMRKGNSAKSGLFIFLATLAKIFPAFLLLPSMLNRKWKTAGLFGIIMVSTLIAIFFWNPQSILGYPEIMKANSQIFRGYYGNFGLNGLVGRIFIGYSDIQAFYYSEQVYRLSLMFLSVVVCLITAFYIYKVKDVDKQISISIIAMLLLSPTTWAHSWTILILPGAILYQSSKEESYSKYRYGLIAVFVLSAFPHWQFLNWLKTILPTPMPAWIGLTPGGLYVLPCIFLLFLAEAIQRFGRQKIIWSKTRPQPSPMQPG